MQLKDDKNANGYFFMLVMKQGFLIGFSYGESPSDEEREIKKRERKKVPTTFFVPVPLSYAN